MTYISIGTNLLSSLPWSCHCSLNLADSSIWTRKGGTIFNSLLLSQLFGLFLFLRP